ncbi:hypothetical protein P691DRAFT_396019 [Macrolepiota fuliginosa MF-IS2]|uniref:Uncharacterized protein n=1 Tax=Macrolepiota fuliginosa MF-IS2 TaxID=1400762 RepID=A0A9P6C6V4_9AGAR|nr:hypothetical protein P691DRAFT_396019 [Macrolepiota fuliginosa MF-IS2]
MHVNSFRSTMTLPAEAVQSIGQTLEALSQGLYISAFYRCIIILLEEKRRRIPYHMLMGTSLSLFVVGMTHFVAGVCLNVRNVIEDATSAHVVAERLRDYSFVISTAISNGFMVYRCLVVWNNYHRIILFPSILCLASLSLGVWLVIVCSQKDLPMFDIPMIPKLFSFLTFSLNLLISGLILYRIWGIQREISRVVERENRFIRRTTTLVIESGALHSILLLVLIIASYTSRSATTVICNCIVPLLGMVVSAIILRIGKGISHGDPVTSIPIEFRNSTFSNATKGPYLSTSLPANDSDNELEVSRTDRLILDLTN